MTQPDSQSHEPQTAAGRRVLSVMDDIVRETWRDRILAIEAEAVAAARAEIARSRSMPEPRTEAGRQLLRDLRAEKPGENWVSIVSWVEVAIDEIEIETMETAERLLEESVLAAVPPFPAREPEPGMAAATKAEGLLSILDGNARYTDRRSRNTRAITAFVLGIKAAARAEVAEQVRALPGYRDPRYSGQFESKGIIDRAAVLALLDQPPPEVPETDR